jgi:hypothetical protein
MDLIHPEGIGRTFDRWSPAADDAKPGYLTNAPSVLATRRGS